MPLVWLTANRTVMGPWVNRRVTTLVGGTLGALVICLNVFLVYRLTLA